MSYLELDPARAKTRDPEEFWDHPEWMLEPKLDGWRWISHFGGDLDRTYLTGRRTSKETGTLSEKGLLVPQLHVTPSSSLGYTVLDGEVMPPGGSGFHDLAGIMNADYDTVQKTISRVGPPSYHVFDVLFADGIDVRDLAMIERRRVLERVMLDVRNPLYRLIDQLPPSRYTYESIVDAGGEGVILKNICAAYGDKSGWVKVKRYSTLDVIVTGFTDARFGRTGKYTGQIGAAQVAVRDALGDLVEVGQVSGMTDELRLDMTKNPESWIGRVIEVAAQEFAKNRLRHPRFKRARPDADPQDATWEKMMSDLGQNAEQRVVRGEQRCLPL